MYADFPYAQEYHISRGGWCQVLTRVSKRGVMPVRARVKGTASGEAFTLGPPDVHEASLCPLTWGAGALTMCGCCGFSRRSIGWPKAFICGQCLEAGCAPSARAGGKFGFFTCRLEPGHQGLNAVERSSRRLRGQEEVT